MKFKKYLNCTFDSSMDDVENSKFEKYVQKDWDGNMTGKMSYILNRKLLKFKWHTYWTINGCCYGPPIFWKLNLVFEL